MNRKRILISGGGIAGLTLAIQLKQASFDPLLIEREGGLRREGYMMDFFGTGWDVAEGMALPASCAPCATRLTRLNSWMRAAVPT